MVLFPQMSVFAVIKQAFSVMHVTKRGKKWFVLNQNDRWKHEQKNYSLSQVQQGTFCPSPFKSVHFQSIYRAGIHLICTKHGSNTVLSLIGHLKKMK